MEGMDDGPGTSLGTLGWFAGAWVTMTAAMMLPSVEPTVLLFTRVAKQREGAGFAPTWFFVAGYLAVWTVFGLTAYGVYRLVVDSDPAFLACNRAGPYVVAATLVASGLYELSGAKRFFLRHCRNRSTTSSSPGGPAGSRRCAWEPSTAATASAAASA
jgi:predicted metal-binding membrane protein